MICKSAQKGAALFEFMIVVPFLFLLILTVCEFGLMFLRMQAIDNSVQDATRYLSDQVLDSDFNSNSAAQRAIAANLITYGSVGVTTPLVPNALTITINRPPAPADTQHVQVTVVQAHNLIFGTGLLAFAQMVGVAPGIGGQIPLTTTSIMRFAEP